MTIRALNKLTVRQAETAADGNWSDGGGLYLWVGEGGKHRSWIFRYTSPATHKVRETGLGRAAGPSGDDGVTLKQARAERDRLRVLLRDGADPLESRKAARVEQARRVAEDAGRKTVRQTARAFIEEKQRGWGASSLASWRRFADRDIEPIADLRIDSIGREHLKLCVMPLVGKGLVDTARATQTRLHKLLDHAAEQGWRPEDKRTRFSQIAPATRKDEEPRHHPALDPEKDTEAVRAAVAQLRASPSMSAMALEFTILTASRISEAIGAEWREVDFDKALWTVPAGRMKMGKEHVVPLSGRAVAILTALHAARGRDRKHIFPGDRPSKPVSRNTAYDQAERISGGRASPHGWRSTFRSWCSETGVAFELAEAALAHAKDKVVAAYDRTSMIERRRVVMERWADFLSNENQTAEVIPLASRRA